MLLHLKKFKKLKIGYLLVLLLSVSCSSLAQKTKANGPKNDTTADSKQSLMTACLQAGKKQVKNNRNVCICEVRNLLIILDQVKQFSVDKAKLTEGWIIQFYTGSLSDDDEKKDPYGIADTMYDLYESCTNDPDYTLR